MIAQKISGISALLIVFILGFIRPATAQVDFPIGYVSRGGTYAFISLIEQHKLLEQEGIRPTFVYIGGPQVSQALVSGDIRMAIVAAASPIRAAAHGADLRFVGGVTDKEVASFVAESSIKTPAELKGTRLAIDRLGDYSDFRARKVSRDVWPAGAKGRDALTDWRPDRAVRGAEKRSRPIDLCRPASYPGREKGRLARAR